MIKVLIADDEPKIRQGLFEAVDWEKNGMKVAALAKDGQEALDMAAADKPDLCLIDICMPIIDGLDLIGRLKEINPRMLAVIITGHDEFEYAQQAVKMQVFDYVLKPVCEEELRKIVLAARKHLEEERDRERRYELAESQLRQSMPLLKRKLVSDWVAGRMTAGEVQEQLEFHDLSLGNRLGLVLLHVRDTGADLGGRERERQLRLFALERIMEEGLSSLQPFIAGRDAQDNLVTVVSIQDRRRWRDLKADLEGSIAAKLDRRVEVLLSPLEGGLESVPAVYEALYSALYNEDRYHPIVKEAKVQLEKRFRDPDLSLQEIADGLEVSLSYLSKLFKQETGMSFSDCLIRHRIKESIRLLLHDPRMKIYEVADAVGYSSQHYFSAAFKKVLGVAPSEYRQTGGQEA